MTGFHLLCRESFASYGAAAPAIWQIGLHVFTDAVMLIVGGIIFALFWIETTGMGAKPTAQKIFNSGMQIPGFRRNIGSIEKVMQRYIPKVTVIGGAFIGLLTLVASLLGTLGSAGGTGLAADCEYCVPSVRGYRFRADDGDAPDDPFLLRGAVRVSSEPHNSI